jgi:hypothetical protein
VILFFVPAAVIQSVVLFYALNVAATYRPAVQRAIEIAAQDLPASLCGLSKVDFEAVERSDDHFDGAHSRTYKYRSDDGMTYTVSFDFPFIEYWHELTNCYRGNGWDLLQRRACPYTDPQSKESWEYVEGDFSKPDGNVGALWYSECDQFGKPSMSDDDWNPRPLTFWELRHEYLQPHRLFQAQVWITAPHDVTEAQRQKARDLLLASRELFRSRMMARSNSGETSKMPSSNQAAEKSASTADATPSRSVPVK